MPVGKEPLSLKFIKAPRGQEEVHVKPGMFRKYLFTSSALKSSRRREVFIRLENNTIVAAVGMLKGSTEFEVLAPALINSL